MRVLDQIIVITGGVDHCGSDDDDHRLLLDVLDGTDL